jgi:hypothetical protein
LRNKGHVDITELDVKRKVSVWSSEVASGMGDGVEKTLVVDDKSADPIFLLSERLAFYRMETVLGV